MKVLITGGTGDIAKEIRKLLEKNLYNVLAPSEKEMDVTNLEQIIKVIGEFKPDILINNAGFVVPQSVKDADYSLTKKHIEINLIGTFLCTEVALKNNKNVSIINIGSAAAIASHATWSEYCASKAGVLMATKCWADDGIYTVCISPGRTKSKMRKSLFPDEDQSTLLDPADLAKVVFKAVKKEYCSGEHIVVRKQNVNDLLSE